MPIVMVRFSGLATDAEFDNYLATMTQLLTTRRERTVTILDARGAGRNPPGQRKKQADWIQTNRELLMRYSAGTAFVISNPLIRGVLTAIFWLQPLPTEWTVVGTVAAAEEWARLRLADAAAGPEPL